MKNQLKQLKKVIEIAETDPLSKYTDEEVRYMKTRYRQLREYIQYANRLQKNGFGPKLEPTVGVVTEPVNGPED